VTNGVNLRQVAETRSALIRVNVTNAWSKITLNNAEISEVHKIINENGVLKKEPGSGEKLKVPVIKTVAPIIMPTESENVVLRNTPMATM
jgi:hypothetical protein